MNPGKDLYMSCNSVYDLSCGDCTLLFPVQSGYEISKVIWSRSIQDLIKNYEFVLISSALQGLPAKFSVQIVDAA